MTTEPAEASEPTAPCADSGASTTQVFDAINELSRRLRAFEQRTLRESGLTPPQFFVLSELVKSDGRPLGELAGSSACTRATMTGIVDTLERKALVRRGPNPCDRRGTLAWLTDRGRSQIEGASDLGQMFGSCCCELLPPQDTIELKRLLDKLTENLPF